MLHERFAKKVVKLEAAQITVEVKKGKHEKISQHLIDIAQVIECHPADLRSGETEGGADEVDETEGTEGQMHQPPRGKQQPALGASRMEEEEEGARVRCNGHMQQPART
eukprot:2478065-Rhodomonas_salina.1